MTKWTTTYTLDEVEQIADRILPDLTQLRKALLIGDLGAGKTTLTKAIFRKIGVVEDVTSPTYTIINTYRASSGNMVYHMDLYRLKSIEEAEEIGLEDYLFDDSVCMIEWPEIIEPLLDGQYLVIRITNVTPSLRSIEVFTTNGL